MVADEFGACVAGVVFSVGVAGVAGAGADSGTGLLPSNVNAAAASYAASAAMVASTPSESASPSAAALHHITHGELLRGFAAVRTAVLICGSGSSIDDRLLPVAAEPWLLIELPRLFTFAGMAASPKEVTAMGPDEDVRLLAAAGRDDAMEDAPPEPDRGRIPLDDDADDDDDVDIADEDLRAGVPPMLLLLLPLLFKSPLVYGVVAPPEAVLEEEGEGELLAVVSWPFVESTPGDARCDAAAAALAAATSLTSMSDRDLLSDRREEEDEEEKEKGGGVGAGAGVETEAALAPLWLMFEATIIAVIDAGPPPPLLERRCPGTGLDANPDDRRSFPPDCGGGGGAPAAMAAATTAAVIGPATPLPPPLPVRLWDVSPAGKIRVPSAPLPPPDPERRCPGRGELRPPSSRVS